MLFTNYREMRNQNYQPVAYLHQYEEHTVVAECVLQMPGHRHIPRAVRHKLATGVEEAVHGRPSENPLASRTH